MKIYWLNKENKYKELFGKLDHDFNFWCIKLNDYYLVPWTGNEYTKGLDFCIIKTDDILYEIENDIECLTNEQREKFIEEANKVMKQIQFKEQLSILLGE